MLYLKNAELAEKHHISLGTVRNWIKAAQNGKLDIKLYAKEGRLYVANTASNIATIKVLVQEGKKYRPHRTFKFLRPRPEFYRIYSQMQIHDILTNLEVHSEIPRQYNYFNSGANSWDQYIHRMESEDAPSNLTMTWELLAKNKSYIHGLLEDKQRVNVIDIGPGNALPIKALLADLLQRGKLGRYAAIDISPDMLHITKQNVEKWFGRRVHFEGHELDITRQRFADILVSEHVQPESSQTCNLLLFLGGTIQNFRRREMPLQVIADSMGLNDYLIHTQKLDSPATRGQFDLSVEPSKQAVPDMHSLVISLLNIDPSFYDLEIGYDDHRKERYERIRLKTSLAIDFNFKQASHTVNLSKGEYILLWRASQDTAEAVINLFGSNGLALLQISQTLDQEYMLTVSRLKHES